MSVPLVLVASHCAVTSGHTKFSSNDTTHLLDTLINSYSNIVKSFATFFMQQQELLSFPLNCNIINSVFCFVINNNINNNKNCANILTSVLKNRKWQIVLTPVVYKNAAL